MYKILNLKSYFLFSRYVHKLVTKELPAIPGKVGHVLLSSASGCCIMFEFLFLGHFYDSMNLLDSATSVHID
jgi:hypothetical protein